MTQDEHVSQEVVNVIKLRNSALLLTSSHWEGKPNLPPPLWGAEGGRKD